jgi:hypothetical protein
MLRPLSFDPCLIPVGMDTVRSVGQPDVPAAIGGDARTRMIVGSFVDSNGFTPASRCVIVRAAADCGDCSQPNNVRLAIQSQDLVGPVV